MTPKCAVVATRVIFVEIDEGNDETGLRQRLQTMSMLSIARSAVLFQPQLFDALRELSVVPDEVLSSFLISPPYCEC